ncbi:Purine catabolism regulatory protein-like family protein [Saccharopolyspora kobensis]|uniref:Purine catabolism regulatory protein-like family protein n=1 Tax=Saccharopolyspora kobensis TaxID=146035 RepID=A0A1H6BSG3_9PSEU|nr:PucR family transcriptional regulator ligand-binding domain-containing protein [Saccharopolyspora kobensis]SEG63572.1 Purine catabolism regulatory protein-like family protein [Saccharopolyspora kobensis]SFC14123.1 Purine catabolism regulatory protein-like family protein [Saccharopolyspora kobensis]
MAGPASARRVDELLNLPELDLRARVRGRVDRPIRWVRTIEIESPGRFLRGGEVVLAAGVWRTAGITAEAFVADLVAAVGFGLVPPETQVPEEFAAAEHGLTCFVVPVEVAFLQIVAAFVGAERAEWERPLRRHLAQHDAIVAALRVDRGVGTVVGALAKQLGEPVAVRVAGALVAGRGTDARSPVAAGGRGPGGGGAAAAQAAGRTRRRAAGGRGAGDAVHRAGDRYGFEDCTRIKHVMHSHA